MMAQIIRKYSTNISIVLSFLSLKVSANRTKYQIYLSISEVKPNLDEIRVNHFLRDSQGSCRLSAHLEACRKCGHPNLHRSAAISPQCSFPSMLKLRYYET